MKRITLLISTICLLAVNLHAIGMQHGSFRSQSTQGTPWQGTATIIEERYNITVLADYLDVELEWVFETGGTEPDSFKNALEIVGNLNLVDKSVVIGLITWYKGKILKGKLKTNDVAREEYEEVVERDSDIPPPPRDPVLLEWIRDDNYDISIFPVEWEGTRKVRIRYLIPAFSTDGVNKIAYPHAFTDNAEVSIKNGPGIIGYEVETDKSRILFDTPDFITLNSSEYTFRAYGGSYSTRIAYIIPILDNEISGSKFYIGNFSTPQFKGEMLHVSTISGSHALMNTSIAEDYVILWRWNHPQILKMYARQIVEQSNLLKLFLDKLSAANKRVALIVDIQGGRRITFPFDTKGGRQYRRMLAYLDRLSQREIVDPPMCSTKPDLKLDFDVNKAAEEFKNAIQVAIEMFENNNGAIKHLLLLTAGPNLIDDYIDDQNIIIDSTIDINLLASYCRTMNPDFEVPVSGSNLYWPGIHIGEIINQSIGLSVYATVGNGINTNRILVSSASSQGSRITIKELTQMHLYSDKPVKNEVKWSFYAGDRLLTEYIETPAIIKMEDGMQYARVIGGSPHLVPIADKMPSSLASTLGFIDDKYSLVALEEDALPAEVAIQYETSGVPVLDQSDIFPSDDERYDMPVDEWLAANPPEDMPSSSYAFSWAKEAKDIMWNLGEMILFDDLDIRANAITPVERDFQARIAMPQAEIIYDGNYTQYEDYSAATDVKAFTGQNARFTNKISAFIRKGCLIIDLSNFSPETRKSMSLILYDLSGRIIQRWNSRDLISQTTLSIPLNSIGISRGTYILFGRSGVESFTNRVIMH